MANVKLVRSAVMKVCKDSQYLSYLARLKYGKNTATEGTIINCEYPVATWKIDGREVIINFLDLNHKTVETRRIETPK